MISLDLIKSSDVRKAGDRPNCSRNGKIRLKKINLLWATSYNIESKSLILHLWKKIMFYIIIKLTLMLSSLFFPNQFLTSQWLFCPWLSKPKSIILNFCCLKMIRAILREGFLHLKSLTSWLKSLCENLICVQYSFPQITFSHHDLCV